jgi:signal transduction histidine kinase/ligand-binding sensor domain-containing protein
MLRYLIIFIIYLLPFQGLTQVSPLVSHLDNKQGFDNSSVWAFLQDEKGFMWFGTSSGLWRYDGYTLTKFQYNSSDTTSISDNFTFSLFKDSRDRMWVGTLHGGVNLYNPITNSFQRCFPKDTVMLGSQINEFAEDAMGNIWIASSRGLHKYDGEKLQHLFISKNNPVSNLRNQIRSLYVSRSGIIWLGGYGMGIGSYDPISKKINQLQDYRMNKVANIRRIQEDEAGNLFWIEGTNPTFNRFSPKTNLFYKLSAQEIMGIPGRLWDFSIVGDIIYLATSEGVFALRYSANSLIESIQNISEMYGLPNMNRFHLYIEENKKLWIGTEDSGILGVKLFPLHNIYKNPFPDKNLSDIWHGKGKTFYDFDGKGLWIIDSVRKKTNLIPVQKQGLGFEGKTIHTLAEDGKENLWIGTPEGLFMADFLKNKVKKFTNTADKNSISSSFISTLFIDSKKSIWVLAGGNWNVFNEKYQNFSKGNKKPGSGHSLMYLVETAEGIWVGSMDGGLVLVNRNTYKPIQYFAFDALNPNSISNNSIMALYTDHHGALWVGTNNGLNQYLAKLGSFKRYNLTDGIPEESIIQISGSGNYLAVQTTSGLYQSNLDEPENKFTKIKSPINFVPANGILHYPYFTWKQGNYLSELNINNLPQDTVPPPIAITGFQLDPNNKNQLSLAEQNLNPSYRKHITLQYDQNLFSIEFAVLSFNETKTNQYAYTLEGFDKTWTESGSRRFVTYTNLNPGEYTFRARGATQQGIWSKEDATFTITILPPPWKTWWAYTLYSIGFIGLLFLGRRATVNRERLKAQVAIEQTEKQTLKELDHLKTKFFSNITHEFRTPLTLIQGPANELFEKERNQESKQLLGLIKSNSDRLLKLINQLLDLAKLDALEMKINASSVNIKSLINVTASQFNSLATSKGIDYMLHIADDLPIAIADREKIETMLFNLISNAIKFTETGGHVKVHASWMNQTFILQVSDTGRGIPAAKLKHIFDRFYQVNPTDSSHSEGTGIGLALVKEYTELMKGILEVESTVGAELYSQSNYLLKFSRHQTYCTTKHLKIINLSHQFVKTCLAWKTTWHTMDCLYSCWWKTTRIFGFLSKLVSVHVITIRKHSTGRKDLLLLAMKYLTWLSAIG